MMLKSLTLGIVINYKLSIVINIRITKKALPENEKATLTYRPNGQVFHLL